MKLIEDVDVILAQISKELVFVFVGEEYAGSAERGALDVWSGFPVMGDPADVEPVDSMWSAVGYVLRVHALKSLQIVLHV